MHNTKENDITLKTLIGAWGFAAMLLASIAANAEDSFLILDILPLKQGRSVEEAKVYFEAVEPIFARHGMVRSDKALTIVSVLRGNLDAEVVNLWQTGDPDASIKGIFSDKDYLGHSALRDSIFDLEAATIVVTERQGG